MRHVAFREHPTQLAALTFSGRDLRDVVDPVEVPSHPATALAAVRARDHFTKTEVDALLHLPSLGSRDRLILCILAETGLRRRAVAWLTVDGVYDAVAGTARPVATATEKGLVPRQFLLSAGTRALLEGYVQRAHPHDVASPWLFPSPRQPSVPIRAATVNRILQRACRDLGIRGRHIHSHAMRKFVVVRLMQLSNRIEDVSKWLGHRSVHTTFGTYCPGPIHRWLGPACGMSSRVTWWVPCTSLGFKIAVYVKDNTTHLRKAMTRNLLRRPKFNDAALVHIPPSTYIQNEYYTEGSMGHFLADNGYEIHRIRDGQWDPKNGYWKKKQNFQHPNQNWGNWPGRVTATDAINNDLLFAAYQTWEDACRTCRANRAVSDVSPNFEAFLTEKDWVTLRFE